MEASPRDGSERQAPSFFSHEGSDDERAGAGQKVYLDDYLRGTLHPFWRREGMCELEATKNFRNSVEKETTTFFPKK